MSLHPQSPPPVPEDTARVARAAFPAGNLYLRMRDALDTLYRDEQFQALFPVRGQPAAAPWRLALVTIVQFAEHLSDRQAADAVRGRIDLKHLLSLDLTDPGFDHTVLSEFRARLLGGEVDRLLLDPLLDRCRALGLLKARGRQRTDSTHVLAAVRGLNRLELVRETMRQALDDLAELAPAWLAAHADPAWVKCYQGRSDGERLPDSKDARRALAETIGGDGFRLLEAVGAVDAPAWLRTAAPIEQVRRTWVQNYHHTDAGVRWRTEEDGLPKAHDFVSSPLDPDARRGKKRTLVWVGYKVALTETCEDDRPNLITHVETTAAPVADGAMTPRIHRDLQQQGLLPGMHLVDTGFLDAELLVASRADYAVELLGPTRHDRRWQARAGEGFGAGDFVIDWERRQATCPEGFTSVEWVPRVNVRGNDSIYIRFSAADCGPCPSRARCTRSPAERPRRSIAIRPQAQYAALQERRLEEATPDFHTAYARRAGVEGTLSQGVRRCGMRRSRYVGLAKTHLDHVATAAALNFVRVGEWLAETPRAKTRKSAFAVLMKEAA